MSAGQYDIIVDKYSSYQLTVIYNTGVTDENPSGTPVDNSLYEALLQVRPAPDSPEIYFQATSAGPGHANNYITLEGVTGVIILEIPPEITGSFDFDNGFYDLLLRSPRDEVWRILEGQFLVRSGISVFSDLKNPYVS